MTTWFKRLSHSLYECKSISQGIPVPIWSC